MKYKFYILILAIPICFFPMKIFGFFATPDKYIHSMSFGVQRNTTNIQKLSIPSNLNQINNKILAIIHLSLLQRPILPETTSGENDLANNAPASKNISHPANFTWLIIFFIVAIFVIALFLYAARKKRNPQKIK